MTHPTIAARRLLNQRIAGKKAPTPEAAKGRGRGRLTADKRR